MSSKTNRAARAILASGERAAKAVAATKAATTGPGVKRPTASPDPPAPVKDARAGEIEKLKTAFVNENDRRRLAERRLEMTDAELYRTKEALKVMSNLLAAAESNVRMLRHGNGNGRSRDFDDDLPF